jgi:hypothetical protein
MHPLIRFIPRTRTSLSLHTLRLRPRLHPWIQHVHSWQCKEPTLLRVHTFSSPSLLRRLVIGIRRHRDRPKVEIEIVEPIGKVHQIRRPVVLHFTMTGTSGSSDTRRVGWLEFAWYPDTLRIDVEALTMAISSSRTSSLSGIGYRPAPAEIPKIILVVVIFESKRPRFASRSGVGHRFQGRNGPLCAVPIPFPLPVRIRDPKSKSCHPRFIPMLSLSVTLTRTRSCLRIRVERYAEHLALDLPRPYIVPNQPIQLFTSRRIPRNIRDRQVGQDLRMQARR